MQYVCNVVSAANLYCTVANEGSFQWQWTPSIVQISQISPANAGTIHLFKLTWW